MTSANVALNVRAHRRRRVRRRFLRRPTAVVGLTGVVFVVAIGLLAPFLSPYDPATNDYTNLLASAFSPGHLFGTDELGRDILSRLMAGASTSLLAGLLATLFALAVAVPIGLISGYYRGLLDTTIMRATDVILAFPFLVLAVGLAAIIGPSLGNAILALSLATIPSFLRITRGEVLGLRGQEYVQAAIVNGAPDRVILFRHILPNLVSVLVVQASVTIPALIIGEATLSFLGLGVQPPAASWGTMLSSAQNYIWQAPTLALYPGIAIAITTLSFNLLGDGLRDVLDPRSKK